MSSKNENDGQCLGSIEHPDSANGSEEAELNPESLEFIDLDEDEFLERIKNSRPFCDFYKLDGTLKPYKEDDSEETKQSKRILREFLNKTYTQERDDKISKKFINAMLFGIGYEEAVELIPDSKEVDIPEHT